MDYYFDEERQYNRLKADYDKHGRLVVAVDYDNTLYDLHNIGSSHELVRQLVRDCKKAGFLIVIYSASAKERHNEIKHFLDTNNIPFDGINDDVAGFFRKYPDRDYSKSKIFYSVLLCDRAGLYTAYKALRRVVDEVLNPLVFES